MSHLLSKDFLAKYGPILLIIGGLLVWGGFHALGAYLSLAQKPGWASPAIPVAGSDQGDASAGDSASAGASRRDPRKAVVVGVCTVGFVGFWLLAIVGARWRRARAARRLAQQQQREAASQDAASREGATAATAHSAATAEDRLATTKTPGTPAAGDP